MDKIIQAGKFKAQCLQIMEQVMKTKREIVITKRNVPIVKLVPIEKTEEKFFGFLKGTVRFKGDIVKPIDEVWDADH